ncbi:glyoxalase/bleomycin resistance protein/dioxygenase [Paenibacillus sp. NAIST15-1]|nr:glyoxalase/bleomycin resistance protein/dioxygenase [Paenibacillus sp. NAIST15-1]
MIVETKLSDDFEVDFIRETNNRNSECMVIGTEANLIYIHMTEERFKSFIQTANNALIEYQKQHTKRI